MTIEISLLIMIVTAGISVFSALASVKNNSRKEGKKEGYETGVVTEAMRTIKDSLEEIKAGQREIGSKVECIDRRLIAAEEKLKNL